MRTTNPSRFLHQSFFFVIYLEIIEQINRNAVIETEFVRCVCSYLLSLVASVCPFRCIFTALMMAQWKWNQQWDLMWMLANKFLLVIFYVEIVAFDVDACFEHRSINSFHSIWVDGLFLLLEFTVGSQWTVDKISRQNQELKVLPADTNCRACHNLIKWVFSIGNSSNRELNRWF